MTDVQRFLKEKHHANGYCVYNLCTEEHFAYKPSKFELVANFPFDDHQVCIAPPVTSPACHKCPCSGRKRTQPSCESGNKLATKLL